MTQQYQELTEQLAALVDAEWPMVSNLANAAALLYERLDRLNWAGFYLTDNHVPVSYTHLDVYKRQFQDYTMQFLSLESNLHIPVAGAIVRLMGGIGLPAKLDGWRPVLKRIKQGLDERQMLQIYPEGELIDGCRTLRAFQPGAFQIACWFRKPMIPCLLRFYPRFSKSGRRKRDGMELVILEPVDIPTDKKGKRAATELETQIRCQMEAARLAVGREGA